VEPELWHRVKELCNRALDLDESRRAAFLDHSCGDDEVLRREVESLLAHAKAAEYFIEAPAVEVLGRLVANERETTGSEEKLIGSKVSHYRVLEKLGHGGMGVIYKAEQVTGKRPKSGNTVSHANNRKRRRFLPNLHTHRFWLESEKRFVSLRVTTRGLRTIEKRGVDVVVADLRTQGVKV